jgi:methylmalonyl-CoA mutase
VIHLGHNRSVDEVVDAASRRTCRASRSVSYQGGHVEYFEYLVESLRERGPATCRCRRRRRRDRPDEIERLHAYGVTIFSPEDGQRLGLAG